MKFYTFIFISLFAIFSAQAQNIKVYFNQSVDNTVSSITNAQTSSHLDDTICSLINLSNLTLDIAVFDNGSTKIVAAINAAYTRGVQVRYISSSNSFNSALSNLNTNIPLLKRNANISTNVMHNKIVIVDDSILLMGSMNFGNGNMINDYNNIVIISNPAMAQNYTTEFNEMWGSTGALPNTANSKFGPAKTDNTIHNFTISGIAIQSYFSPTDNTTDQIINAIDSADYTLDIAMFTFINNDLGDAVVAAKNRGVNVRCIIENESYIGSEFNNLVNNGISTLSHQGVTYDFHHKYCIIDAMYPSSDPVVVTGSHNWTNSAEDDNDENTLIIHDEVIANQYTEEFTKRFTELGGNGIDENSNVDESQIYPNPNSGRFFIKNDVQGKYELDIFNSLGERMCSPEGLQPGRPVSLNLKSGIYFMRVISDKTYSVEKIIIK